MRARAYEVVIMEDEEVKRAKQILGILTAHFSVPQLSDMESDPFKVLVRTIISQSTAEANTIRAYHSLSSKMPLNPTSLADADVKMIEDALRVAGLYRNKSKVIKNVSRLILEWFNGSLDFVYSSPLDDARKKLMSMSGIGPKTADIILLFSAKRPTLPVDTHVNRVSKMLGLAPSKAGYEAVRAKLQVLYQPEEYFEVHMLFIALGRNYCRAVKPLHTLCPVNELCPSAKV